MRVLIATVTAGGGHLAAATALEQAWQTERPQDTLKKVDVLDFGSTLYRKLYSESYAKSAEHIPDLYGMLFKKTDNDAKVRKAAAFRRSFATHTNAGFARFLKEFHADLVLCPHFLPLEILGHLEAKHKTPKPFTVAVITDFEAHAFWLEPAVDLYCVAADETRGSLIARGVSPDVVVVTGIPIRRQFSDTANLLDVRRRYGLRDDLPALLVLAGGFGMGPVAEVLSQLDKVEGYFQTLVVAGRNEKLRQELAIQEHTHPTRVLGFCGNMHELMSVSDLLISKPGGLTSSEALALGKPMLIINPIPGQETANSDFLLEHGAAAKVNRLGDIPFRVRELLGSQKLRDMARAAKALGRPQAAQNVCRAVVDRLNQPLSKFSAQQPSHGPVAHAP